MKKVLVSTLVERELDWAVAKVMGMYNGNPPPSKYLCNKDDELFWPSEEWSIGGPIIEREGIDVFHIERADIVWEAEILGLGVPPAKTFVRGCGLTPLIAAMRCYVASKLGYEVEIPEELV